MGSPMLLFGFAACIAVAFWALLRAKRLRRRVRLAVSALLLAGAAVTAKAYIDTSNAPAGREVADLAGVAGALQKMSSPESSPALPAAPNVAAPVASLIAPLEARLEQQPNDVKGWVLLAQSLAYVGNDDGAERAVRRAVALGVDEQTLRTRVTAAGRADSSNWIEQTLGGRR